jgi:hypothetical protein
LLEYPYKFFISNPKEKPNSNILNVDYGILPNYTYISKFKLANFTKTTNPLDFMCVNPQLTYLQNYNVAIPFLEMAFYFILFIIVSILFCMERQPLYSRGLFPLLASFIFFLNTLPKSLFITVTPDEYLGYFYCIIISLVIQPLEIFFMSLSPLSVLRYILLLNLNNTKNSFYNRLNSKDEDVSNRTKNIFKIILLILKYSTSWYSLFISG